MLAYKYFSVYNQNKAENSMTKLNKIGFAAIVDVRRTVLCVLYFFKKEWYLLVFVPLILQILFVFIACIENKKSKIDKIFIILNESIVGVLWILSVLTLTYSPMLIQNDELQIIIWLVVQWILVLILLIQIGIIIYKTIKNFIK